MSSAFNVLVLHRHRKTGIVTEKSFSFLEKADFEAILREAFGIPADEGILVHCNDTIFYPINNTLNLSTVASAGRCELQSFPLAAMNDITSTATGEARPTKKSKTAKAKAGKEEEREDKRKYNRGLNQRRSYLKEEKIFVMLMKDASKSADEISHLTGVSKSNVEKWCSERVREKTLIKFRQEIKHPVVEELLKENALHFSTKEPAKFKILLEVLAERLHLAQNHHHSSQTPSGSFIIPPNAFWNFATHPSIDKSGKRQYLSIYNTDSALQFVLNQGYFFKRKQDKDSVTATTNEKDDSIAREEDLEDSHSLALSAAPDYPHPTTSNDYTNASYHNNYYYPPANLSSDLLQSPTTANYQTSRQQGRPQSSAFISSEESDMMDFILDDQSIASSQWLPLPNPHPTTFSSSVVVPVVIPAEEAVAAGVPIAIEGRGEMTYPADDDNDEEEDLSDDDLDCDEINDLLLATDPLTNDNPNNNEGEEDHNNKREDLSEVLIRQGVLPSLKPSKVCSKPVECRLELMRLLRDDCQGSSTRFVKSDCTMQFRGKIEARVAIDENHPNQLVQISMSMPLHATRGVLRNTKYLSAVRDSLTGKVLTEEEEEDAAVLSLLGE